jgi:uncharacterized membrane protein
VLVVLNLGLLFFVSLIPFAAKLLAEHLRGSPGEQRLTAALYVGAVLGEALFFNASWWWARRRGLLRIDMRSRLARAVARRYRYGPWLYLAAFAVVFVDPVLSLCCYLGLVWFYVLPGAGDLQGRGASPSLSADGGG